MADLVRVSGPVAAARDPWMSSPHVAALGYLHLDSAVQSRKAIPDERRSPDTPLSPLSQPISPARFAHFALRTGQFEKMIEWYQTVLATRIVFRDERMCFLSYDDAHHRLPLINIPGLPVRDLDAVGTEHVAYSYNKLGELLSTYAD